MIQTLQTPHFSWPHLPEGELRVRGALPLQPGLAIVGARGADPYGLEIAARVARSAVERGLAVISGGAFGIDAAAHRAALEAAGRTVVVLGAGLDHPSPRSHLRLFDAILEGGGALASPFPDGQEATRWSFPRRNPWIAGLSRAVVVVQAGQKSGSLHTARAALAAGVPVWAVPGPMDSPLHQGCHALINAGARLLTAADAWCDEPSPARATAAGPVEGRALWLAAGAEPRALAELAVLAGVDGAEAMAQATLLELDGWLRAAPGGRYVRRER